MGEEGGGKRKCLGMVGKGLEVVSGDCNGGSEWLKDLRDCPCLARLGLQNLGNFAGLDEACRGEVGVLR